MAAGLAVAVAAKDSRRRSRFVAGIDLDLSSDVLDVDSSLSSCSSSSLAVCTPVSDVQRNIVVRIWLLLFLVVRLPRNRVMFIIFILTKYCISIYSGIFRLWRIHFLV